MPTQVKTKAPAGPRPATFDHLKKKPPLERTVRIVLSDEGAQAYEAASEALERAKLTGQPTDDLMPAVEAARKALEAEVVTMRFRSIGRKAYDALLREHPATEAQKAEATKDGTPEPPYDIDGFAPALVAASCIEPQMTEEQVRELWDEWNAAEVVPCWIAALEVNTQRRVVDLGKASG